MKSPLLLMLPLALAAAAAGAAVYSWKDANGHMVYSDHPPSGSFVSGPAKELDIKVVHPAPPAAAASAPQGKGAVAAPPPGKPDEANAAIRAQNCQRSRYNLTILQQRLYQLRAVSGTAVAAAEADTNRQFVQTQKDISTFCTNP